ncbi:hypothetical protein ACKFKF_13340 [Phormidesmis sp. 146-12]
MKAIVQEQFKTELSKAKSAIAAQEFETLNPPFWETLKLGNGS